MRKLIVLLPMLVLVVMYTNGQKPYDFKHYKVEHGLSNNTVLCARQDKNGFMWFGTIDGLNRFDGYSFKTFRNDPENKNSIGNNSIYALFSDANGFLWVGTSKGLYQFNPQTEEFALIPSTEVANIRSIGMDTKGDLWFILSSDLYSYNLRTKQIRNYHSKIKDVTAFCFTQDGTLWVSTIHGQLKKLNKAVDLFVDAYQNTTLAPKRIERIFDTRKGSLFVGTFNQGLKLFDLATATFKDVIVYDQDRTQIYTRDFLQYADNEYWIATEYGIFIYNISNNTFTKLVRNYDNGYSLSDNAVNTLFKDKEGGTWVGTRFGGINYYAYPFVSFKKYFAQNGSNSISGNGVHEICPDHNGNLWIGTEDAGLNKMDIRTGRFEHYIPDGKKGSITYSNIHGLLVDKGYLWIGTFQRGLDKMNLSTGKIEKHYDAGSHSLRNNFIIHIFKTSDGVIYAGTWSGLYKYTEDADDFVPVPNFQFHTQAMIEDEKGVLWICTFGNGFYKYNPKTGAIQNFRHDAGNANSLSNNMVNGMFRDSKGIWWFATEGGLCRFNAQTNQFKTYSTKHGLPSNFLFKILEDQHYNLWISSTKGLIQFDPVSEKLKTYTTAHGLLSDQFNWNSAYKDSTGQMYFGSVNGMVSFKPDDFSTSHFTPPVYITGFQVDNKELATGDKSPLQKAVAFTDKITLKYNQSSFSIDFAALSFSTPAMNEYAYKMDGIDKDWTYLKTNRTAYFTDLSPGTYRFKVKASNSSGIWNEKETVLAIEILPPFWASSWAYLFYSVSIIFIIYTTIKNYHNRIAEKNSRKIELLEHEKEKELYQAKIEFFTNVAHEVRTPLTLIRGPMEKVMMKAGDLPEVNNQLKIMERNTNRLVELTNQLLDFRKTEAKGFSLSFVQVNISEIIKEMYSNFKSLAEQKKLKYVLILPHDVLYAMVDTDALNKILSNLYSNAIKYANKKVEVRLLPFSSKDNCFRLQFKNDGYLIPEEAKEKIFEPFYRIKDTDVQPGTGIGLSLSRSLAELHKGTIELKLSDASMNTFELTLPIRQERRYDNVNGTKSIVARDVTI